MIFRSKELNYRVHLKDGFWVRIPEQVSVRLIDENRLESLMDQETLRGLFHDLSKPLIFDRSHICHRSDSSVVK